ncbi:MAG: hypothetical protein LBI44_05660 [Oscillospiraceae bacterium]|jgi:hypothetical protein|nr:hypothetical protein [Oscillospiraceae bacterium]
MKDNYDLKNPRPNPYAERMKNGYTIIIEREPDEDRKDCETETDDGRALQISRRRSEKRKAHYGESAI